MEFFLWATCAHEYMAILVKKKKMTGIACRGVLKELRLCDFDKTCSACQCSCCK